MKCVAMPRNALPGPPEVMGSRLRHRPELPVSQTALEANRERGLQAAKAVLLGDVSPLEACSKFSCSSDVLRYYRKKLLEQGMEQVARPHTPAGYTDLSNRSESMSSNYASAWDDYSAAYIYAGQLMSEHGRHKAAAMASEKFRVRISASSALRASRRPGEGPSRGGKRTVIPAEVEHKLESICLAIREMKLPLFRFMVVNYLNVLIKGTVYEEQLRHREVRRHWYYNWLGRCKRLTTANIRPLEITRAQWATPENVSKHYDMLRDKLLDLKLAVRNDGYDPAVSYAQEIKIVKPSRIASMDETRH